MNWEDVIKELAKLLKAPETVDEAMDYIRRDANCSAVIEDMAYKQVVLNVLVAAGIVSEKDFNDSIAHFREAFIRSFAESMMRTIKGEQGEPGIWVNVGPSDPPADDAGEDQEWRDDGKPLPKA